MTGDPDAAAVMDALRGSERAFEYLHQEYVQSARAFARRILRCPSLAEAVVNDTFAKAFHILHLWDIHRGSFKTWLFEILKNSVIDAHRRERAERRRAKGYSRAYSLYDPGDVAVNDPCELHSERWFLAPVREEVDRVLAKLGPERRSWLVRLPDRRQLDVEKAAMSRARREIAVPLDIHRSGPALREAVARELLLTKICGKHAGGAHL